MPGSFAASSRSSPPPTAGADRRGFGRRSGVTGLALTCAILATAVVPPPAAGESVRVRYPEGPAHGFVVVSDLAGTPLASGELLQWLERGVVASRLVIHFDDGSLYDEIVRFTQRPFFRVVSYHLVHRGPSFGETTDVSFDRSGGYRARCRPKPDAEEETSAGHVDVPGDVSNGMISTLLKNLPPGTSATVHVLTFRPKPLVLEVHLAPEGSDRFVLGPVSLTATRFVVEPRVRGLTGLAATVAGKQPSPLRMWIAQGIAPTLVRFEGPLYDGGPSWRVELSGPRTTR